MENHHFLRKNSLFLWPFSIAMLNYQRVLEKSMQLHGGLTSTLHSFLLVYLSYRRLLPMSKHIAIGYPNFELGQACLPDTRYRHKTLLAKLPFCWVNSWNSLVHNFSAPSNPLGHLQNSAEFAGVNPPRVVFVPRPGRKRETGWNGPAKQNMEFLTTQQTEVTFQSRE